MVEEVRPAHDALYEDSSLYFRFDQKMKNDEVTKIMIDYTDLREHGSWDESWCTDESGCFELQTKPLREKLSPGIHNVALHFRTGVFRSRFRVSGRDAEFNGVDAVIDPLQSIDPNLVAIDFKSLTFSAVGATFVRMRNADKYSWSEWERWEFPLEKTTTKAWESTPGVPVLAQFWVAGSTGYLVGGCRDKEGNPCNTAFYNTMSMRGVDDEWNDKIRMELVEPWTWAGDAVVDGVKELFFVPFDDGSARFGTIMTLPLQRAMMKKTAGEAWPDHHTTLASGAEWAQPLRVDACCNVEHSIGDVPGYEKETMESHEGMCWWQKSTCRIMFNDRTYQVRLEVVKHLEHKWPVWKIIVVSLACVLGGGGLAYLAWRYCSRRRSEKREVSSGGQPLQEAGGIEMEAQGTSAQEQ
mmetsp:Transcript_61087/g.154216  ORF Transcript_61087/g.154216 Transcript_61087/m.154216 type:complete len:411 (+) Transcript_61087:112-1344(+)